MKDFRFRDEWKEHNKLFGIVISIVYLLSLGVFNYIKNNTGGAGLDLDILVILLIVFGTMLVLTTTIIVIYIISFSVKSKTVDINSMFPMVKQCPVFSNVGNLSLSSKEDILKWYNVVEYDEIGKLEQQLDPISIVGDEHIWLVTSDLKLELNDKTLISTIKDNIEKGIKYTYFLQDNKNMQLEIKRLNNIYGEGKIEIILLNEQCKLLFQLFDVIIFNPINDYSNAYICVDFTDPRKYRKFTVDDAKNLITILSEEKKAFLQQEV